MAGEMTQKFEVSWRVFHLVLASFFSLACYVNGNDPDWFLWMPIYFMPGFLCLSAALHPRIKDRAWWYFLTSSLFYGCLLYACYEAFALLGVFARNGIQNPFAFEEGRELGGLTIIVIWASMNISWATAKSCGKTANQNVVTSMPWILISLAVIPLAYWLVCYIPSLGANLSHCKGMKLC